MSYFNEFIINFSILRENVKKLKRQIGDQKFCAVVKADAYGLGVKSICQALKDDVDFFAVNCLNEALEIREFDNKTKIIILGKTRAEDYEVCANNNISISVDNIKDLPKKLKLKNAINIHIQFNSGMNRLGTKSANELKKICKIINKNTCLNLEGVYTHYSLSDKGTFLIKTQFDKLNKIKNALFLKNITKNALFHASSSGGVVNFPELNFDMVRVGFALYGGSKITKPILSIKATLIKIFEIKKGERIGYEPAYVASKKMKIGIVSMGYADGFSRDLSNNFKVLINGQWARVIGLVCMDMFFVDLTNIKAKAFDEVTILGHNGSYEITLSDYAKALSTNEYEVLTNFRRKRMELVLID